MSVFEADLTAAARIRNAALRSFAERGFAGTSMRGVAEAAGVSPALVQHHFGSKGGLRVAVDEFVVGQAAAALAGVSENRDPHQVVTDLSDRIATFIRANPDLFAYVRRALLEGGETGRLLFDTLFGLARAQIEHLHAAGALHEDLDLDWAALQVVLLNVGAMLLEDLVNAHLDQPILSDEGLLRLRDAMTSLHVRGTFRTPPTG